MYSELSKKKIAIYLASLRGGGAERAVLTLANCFVRQGVKVDLVLVSAEGPYINEVDPAVRVINFNYKRVLFSIPKLACYLKQEKPDILLSAMSHVNVAAVIARLIARSSCRLVLSERSHLSLSAKHAPSLRGRIMPFMVKLFYNQADLIVAVSKGVKDDLISRTGLSEDKVQVIYNPVVTKELIKKAKEPVNHIWLNDFDLPVIIGVGRLSKEKEFATLIRSFKQLLELQPAKLIILGEGEERSNLEKLIAHLNIIDNVSLPGFVSNPYAYMSKASLLVLSSSWEGLPNVLIQAMACGCPVVSTDCPSGPAEILDYGKYGPLTPVGDVEAMAQAIVNVLNTPPDREVLRERANHYSAENISKEYLEALLP